MKRFALPLLALALTGCALPMRLLEDGKAHPGQFSPASRSMEATIDGDRYSGPISQGMTVGFGTAFSGGRTAFGTGIGSSNQFQGLMMNKDRKVINCQFQSALGMGTGMCEALDGRRFALVIGDLPEEAAAKAPPAHCRGSTGGTPGC